MNSEMHFEAVIERVWRCTWRPRSSELRAALGGHDRSNFGDARGGGDRTSLEMQLEIEIE